MLSVIYFVKSDYAYILPFKELLSRTKWQYNHVQIFLGTHSITYVQIYVSFSCLSVLVSFSSDSSHFNYLQFLFTLLYCNSAQLLLHLGFIVWYMWSCKVTGLNFSELMRSQRLLPNIWRWAGRCNSGVESLYSMKEACVRSLAKIHREYEW